VFPKYLNQRDPWMLAEDIPDSDIFFFQIPFSCFTNETSYDFIEKYSKVIATFERFRMQFYFGKKNSFEVGESILNALLEHDDFGDNLNKNIVDWSYKLINFAEKVKTLPIKKYSNKELWDLYKEHDDVHTKLYTYGWLPVSVDMFHNNLTNYFKKYLSSICNNKERIEEIFITLTTPTENSILNQEQNDFFSIYLKNKNFFDQYKKEDSIPNQTKAVIEDHAKKWGHLGYIYVGNASPFGVDHYVKELIDVARSNVDVRKIKNELEQQQKNTRRDQEKIYSELKIDIKHQNLFETASQFALTKLIRRHAQLFDLCVMHKYLLSEISLRLDLTRYQVQFMLKEEVRDALLKNKLDKEVLVKRLKSCVYYTEEGFEKVYVDDEAKKINKQLEIKIDKNIQELKGQSARPGKASGVVKIIIRAHDMDKMNQGDILVSIATDPDIVPAMKKAGAIVTEQGGITSHAAIVSRELGIPCVIGTKIATKIFNDGDRVEVDATKGIVRKI